MLTSLLSLMMLSLPLSSIYSKYISLREINEMPKNIRYVIDEKSLFIERDQGIIDVTEQVNERLKYFGINRLIQKE